MVLRLAFRILSSSEHVQRCCQSVALRTSQSLPQTPSSGLRHSSLEQGAGKRCSEWPPHPRLLESVLLFKQRMMLFIRTFGEPVWPSGKQKDFGSNPLRLSFVFKKVVLCGPCLVTLSLTTNETLKCLSSLPILMQESFWW